MIEHPDYPGSEVRQNFRNRNFVWSLNLFYSPASGQSTTPTASRQFSLHKNLDLKQCTFG